jgi:hypothetical protein
MGNTADVTGGKPIDLVLIDPQSVGKRTHDLMDTVSPSQMSGDDTLVVFNDIHGRKG